MLDPRLLEEVGDLGCYNLKTFKSSGVAMMLLELKRIHVPPGQRVILENVTWKAPSLLRYALNVPWMS